MTPSQMEALTGRQIFGFMRKLVNARNTQGVQRIQGIAQPFVELARNNPHVIRNLLRIHQGMADELTIAAHIAGYDLEYELSFTQPGRETNEAIRAQRKTNATISGAPSRAGAIFDLTSAILEARQEGRDVVWLYEGYECRVQPVAEAAKDLVRFAREDPEAVRMLAIVLADFAWAARTAADYANVDLVEVVRAASWDGGRAAEALVR